jgi:hypothetical protein
MARREKAREQLFGAWDLLAAILLAAFAAAAHCVQSTIGGIICAAGILALACFALQLLCSV